MKLKLILYLILVFSTAKTFSQNLYSINGKVKSDKGNPIEYATVFLEGSTQLTKTNSNGEFIFEGLKPGNHKVVIKMLGYSSLNETLIINDKKVNKDFILSEISVQLKEVAIGNNSKRKELMEVFFLTLIGRSENAASCKILNPEVIEFSTNGNVLQATSKDFIIIENKNLGYHLKYLINDFRHNTKSQITVYDGSCNFEEMPGNEKLQTKSNKNRRLAYNGSLMHFLRSLYAGNTEAEGFLCDQTKSHETSRALTPHDVRQYVSKSDRNFINFKTKYHLRFFYLGKPISLRSKYSNVHIREMLDKNIETNYISLYVDSAVIDSQGSYLDYKSFLLDGNWARNRLGDRLPFSYLPN